MAASTGFKQECPSCGAAVPIKDRKLIGKKIDCPMCKFRFVVEEPPAATDADTEAAAAPAAKKTKPKLDQAVTARRPVSGAGPAPRSKAPAPQRRRRGEDDDDDDEEEAPAATKTKVKKGSPNVLILGGGLAAVAVVLLGVFAVMHFTKKEPRRVLPPPVVEDDPKDATKPKKVDRPVVGANFTEITNLLPNDTQEVWTCTEVKALLNSPFGRAAFRTPGAFRKDLVKEQTGLDVDDVEKIVLATNATDDWLFAVVRTTKPLDVKAVEAALNLKLAEPIENQGYFTADVGDFLKNLSQSLIARPAEAPKPEGPRPLAVRLVNPHTMVLADLAPMKAFLAVRGQPTVKTPPPPPPEARDLPPPSKNYLSINPALKTLMDRLESRPGTLIAVASDTSVPILQKAAEPICVPLDITVDTDLEALGFSFQRKEGSESSMTGSLAVECKTQEIADPLPEKFRTKASSLPWFTMLPDIRMVRIEPDARPFPADMDRKLPRVIIKPAKLFKTAFLSVELSNNQRADPWLVAILEPLMVRARGALEMASGRPRWRILAGALRAYVEQSPDKSFPRGTFAQETSNARFNRPWGPDQNVSWMVDLLPFMGEEYKLVRSLIDEKRSWRELDNLRAGRVLVPAFLAPGNPSTSWWARLPSLPDIDLGATHFVGIAGVGPDAATYMSGDADVADKLGIFGYNRQTKLSEIARPATTIAIAQVPPTYRRPWIAGGGATIAGVPETKSIEPFVCTKHDGKPGTHAIMADGSVRFVPATISDALFKAMCTLKGGDPAQVEKETVLVAPPGKVELRPALTPPKQ